VISGEVKWGFGKHHAFLAAKHSAIGYAFRILEGEMSAMLIAEAKGWLSGI
jgi:hypothetical protein